MVYSTKLAALAHLGERQTEVHFESRVKCDFWRYCVRSTEAASLYSFCSLYSLVITFCERLRACHVQRQRSNGAGDNRRLSCETHRRIPHCKLKSKYSWHLNERCRGQRPRISCATREPINCKTHFQNTTTHFRKQRVHSAHTIMLTRRSLLPATTSKRTVSMERQLSQLPLPPR